MKFLRFWKPVIIGLIILYGSLSTGDKLPGVHFFDFKHFDKLAHLTLYMVFTISLYHPILTQTNWTKYTKIFGTLLITIIYGLIMESSQYMFTDDRTPELLDTLANTLGSIIGIVIYPLLVKLKFDRYL